MKTWNYTKTEEDSFDITVIKTVDLLDVSIIDAFVRGTVVTYALFISSKIRVSSVQMLVAEPSGEVVLQKLMEGGNDANKAKEGNKESAESLFSVMVDTGALADLWGVGPYQYQFILNTSKGKRRVKRENGCSLMASTDSCAESWKDAFLLTIYEERVPLPEWLYGGISYSIFIDRFNKSGQFIPKGDAILNTDWENGIPPYSEYPPVFHKNNIFFGGDLRGIAEKLDHIATLGVNCICLSPIFESGTNNRFAAADFLSVDSMIGGEDAFAELVRTAERKGIQIILDADFGITADNSRYFNKYGSYPEKGAYKSPTSPYYSWYTFCGEDDGYDCRFSFPSMPRLNFADRSLCDFIAGEGGVVAYHTAAGACGFRLYNSEELPPVALLKIKGAVRRERKEGVVYGALRCADAAGVMAVNRLIADGSIDSFVNYPIREAVIRYLAWKDFANLRGIIELICSAVPMPAQNIQMNILGSYDTCRIITALAGESDVGKRNAERAMMKLSARERGRGIKLQKLAYLIVATLPGIPCIFYGDETGLEGYGNPFNRRCFPWHKMEGKLFRWYKKVGQMRRQQEIYKDSLLKINFATEDVLIYSRISCDTAAITIINRSDRVYRITSDSEFISLLSNVSEPATSIDIPPLSGTVLINKIDDSGKPADFKVLRR